MATRSSSKFASGVQGHIQIQRKVQELLDTSSNINTVAANIGTELDQLNIQLKADEDGIIELRSELERIRIEKEHIQRRLKRNTLIMTNYDKQIGPIDQIYAHNVEAIGNLYNNAKEKHAKGIDVLKNNFDYHPLYSKGRKNEMRGIPFTPK